jgi:hypothetical protein
MKVINNNMKEQFSVPYCQNFLSLISKDYNHIFYAVLKNYVMLHITLQTQYW